MATFIPIGIVLLYLTSFIFLPTVTAAEVWCATPNSTEGHCIEYSKCPELKNVFINADTPLETLKYIKQAQCGFSKDSPQVCCQTSTTYKEYVPLLNKTEEVFIPVIGNRYGEVAAPPKETCGEQMLDNRIIEGTIASIEEFPWMALLRYKTKLGSVYLCGGVLINSRYVLSAAHCVTGPLVQSLGKLENVTLGEYDISKQKDCDFEWDEDLCVDQTEEIPVQSTYPHPQYNYNTPSRHHDIAVLKLMRAVEFTDYIKPICLPPDNVQTKSLQTTNFLYISGWGSTKTDVKSNIKMKAKVPVTDFNQCSKWYQAKGINLIDSQICAGAKKKDACRGDSGGPLMYLNIEGHTIRWYLLGIISFGYKDCGTSDISSIYTKVGPYIPWINSIMK